jgi:hypothetical protein
VTDRAAPLSCERSSSTTAVAHNMTARTLEPAFLEDRSKIGFGRGISRAHGCAASRAQLVVGTAGTQHARCRALEQPVCRPRDGALTFVTDRAAPLSCERSSATAAVAHNMTARTLEPALLVKDRSKIGFRNLEGARFAERRAHRWWSARPEPNTRAAEPSNDRFVDRAAARSHL